MLQVTLKALGAENGKFLSHALDKVWLQDGVKGEGEIFILETLPNGNVALACLGAETGKYLSHANGKLWLQDGIQGEGEEWVCHDSGNPSNVWGKRAGCISAMLVTKCGFRMAIKAKGSFGWNAFNKSVNQ